MDYFFWALAVSYAVSLMKPDLGLTVTILLRVRCTLSVVCLVTFRVCMAEVYCYMAICVYASQPSWPHVRWPDAPAGQASAVLPSSHSWGRTVWCPARWPAVPRDV